MFIIFITPILSINLYYYKDFSSYLPILPVVFRANLLLFLYVLGKRFHK